MEISLQSDQFKGKTSIKGLFVVGVYSEEGATFQLEIDILDHDIEKIYKGTTRTIEQPVNTTYYYSYNNWARNPLKFQWKNLKGTPYITISTH